MDIEVKFTGNGQGYGEGRGDGDMVLDQDMARGMDMATVRGGGIIAEMRLRVSAEMESLFSEIIV